MRPTEVDREEGGRVVPNPPKQKKVMGTRSKLFIAAALILMFVLYAVFN